MASKVDRTAYNALRAEIKAGTLRGAYVFYGEETYLLGRTIEEIQKQLLAPGAQSFNLHILDAPSGPEDIAKVVDTLPMLSEHTLVIVRDYDLYKLGEQIQAQTIALIEDVPEYCVLLFVYDTIPFKKDARRKIHSVLKKRVKLVEFALNDAEKLVPWVRRHCRDGKKDISAQDAEYLLFKVGYRMSVLLGETEKLIAYARGEVITREEIDEVVVPSLEAESFRLTQTLCEGRNDQTFELLDRLFLLRQEPIAILGAMGWQLRRLYVASLTALERGGAELLMKRCQGMNPYSARMMMQLASKLPPSWCRSALKLCARVDYELKSGVEDEHGAIELLIIRLAEEKRRHVENTAGHRR